MNISIIFVLSIHKGKSNMNLEVEFFTNSIDVYISPIT